MQQRTLDQSRSPLISANFSLQPDIQPFCWGRDAIILTASVGMGHNRAAQAIAQEIERSGANAKPQILDILNFMNPVMQKLYGDGYAAAAKYTPSMLGKLYDLSDSPRTLSGIALTVDEQILKRLSAYLIKQ